MLENGIFFSSRSPQTPSPTSRQRYFTDKRCESFFSCSLAADSSLCTGDQPSALEFMRSASSRWQSAQLSKEECRRRPVPHLIDWNCK